MCVVLSGYCCLGGVGLVVSDRERYLFFLIKEEPLPKCMLKPKSQHRYVKSPLQCQKWLSWQPHRQNKDAEHRPSSPFKPFSSFPAKHPPPARVSPPGKHAAGSRSANCHGREPRQGRTKPTSCLCRRESMCGLVNAAGARNERHRMGARGTRMAEVRGKSSLVIAYNETLHHRSSLPDACILVIGGW